MPDTSATMANHDDLSLSTRTAGPLLLTDPWHIPTAATLADTTPDSTSASADESLVADYPATQTTRIRWSPDNVIFDADGTGYSLILDKSPDGAGRPYSSGEVLTQATAATGTWDWDVRLPDMVSGAVFGMFLYQADPAAKRVEFDIEFVGANTARVELNVHMQDDTGRMHRLLGGPLKLDLPFDAADGVHNYAITVTGSEGIFRADGIELARFDASDMPRSVWRVGEMRAYTNLWVVSPGGPEYWAGVFTDPGRPLVARIEDMDTPPVPQVPPGDRAPDISGTAGDDVLTGTLASEIIVGLGGADTLQAGRGSDTVWGGGGNDRIALDGGHDVIDGGTGLDWLRVTSASGARVDLLLTGPQDTGMGMDTITNVENILGGVSNDRLSGNAGANRLEGGRGADTLFARAGNDTITGGGGRDVMDGGLGADVFVFNDYRESQLYGSDTIHRFAGEDRLDLSAIATAQPLSFGAGPRAFGIWTVGDGTVTRVHADMTGDGRTDFLLELSAVFALTAAHLIL
ncbi:MAG: hypothetical protein RIR62_2812 [Pseudomonadota bacterium]|jgi:Ca2+-binding RTX toxin-like protein